MYEVRSIGQSEFDDAIKLSEYSFKYVLEGEKRQARARFMEDHRILGAYFQGEMVAKLHVLPLAVRLEGQDYRMGGVASISTYPEHRRRGLVHRLIGEAELAMRESGQVLSYLHPFDISFYRRYGYEIINDVRKAVVARQDLFHYQGIPGQVERISSEGNISILNLVYHKFAEKYSGMLVRSEKWWHFTKFNNTTFAIYYNEAREPRGYLQYQISGEMLQVDEYVYLDEESRRGLWNFVANHDSMVARVEITLAGPESMPFLWRNPAAKMEIMPDFMGKVVMVKEFLEQYLAQKHVNLTLGVRDTSVHCNNALFTISPQGVTYSAQEAATLETACQHADGLSMDINAFTAAFLGSQRPEFLHESGLIRGSKRALETLQTLVPKKPCAFLDYF